MLEEDLVIMVAKSDGKILFYKADYENLVPLSSLSLQSLVEDEELNSQESPVITIHSHSHISCFLIALGCQDGRVKLVKYTTRWEKLSCQEVQLDGPISSVKLGKIEPGVTDLLVTSTVGYAVVYSNVAENLFSKKTVLKPDTQEAITCCTLCDVNFDGQKEIILGSYSQEVFCYRYCGESFQCLWKVRFLHPVMCVCPLDLNRDGVFELLVVTLFGIYLFSPDFKLALQKLKAVKDSLRN